MEKDIKKMSEKELQEYEKYLLEELSKARHRLFELRKARRLHEPGYKNMPP